MKSPAISHTVYIEGHKTAVSVEDAFWSILQEIAQVRGATVSQTIAEIDRSRQSKNRSSAIRLFVLGHVRDQKMRRGV